MEKKKILFVTSEAVPFIKTGGLADVAGTLPKYFDSEKYDVRVVLPKYLCMKPEWKDKLTYVTHFYMDLAWRKQYVGILTTEVDGITFYFIDNEFYFGGDKPYGEIRGDIEKFIYFSRAALSALPVIGFRPDIIHCHDWQSGLVPVYLNDSFQGDLFFRGIRTIMTIHNLKFQGIYGKDVLRDIAGLSDEYFTSDKLEAYNAVNLLKGGIVYADRVTTVSNTYAEEIKTPEYGENLDPLLRAKSGVLSGIVNGIDYVEFDPETNKNIEHHFNADNFRWEKVKNKLALQRELGLTEDPDVMMIGIVSRLTDQKGFDLIDYVMDELCQDAVQLVILGTGEARYEDMFRYYADKYKGKVSANIYYSEPLSHKIYASCDAFLMPSRFEPCGLSQLMSLRYGTVPIVRATGGLKDTVDNYNVDEKTGTGFSFVDYNAHYMLDTVRYAEKIFYDYKEDWNNIVERGMKTDYSWNASAVKYEALYDELYAEFLADEKARIAAEKKAAKEAEKAAKAAAKAAAKEAEKAAKVAEKAAAKEAEKAAKAAAKEAEKAAKAAEKAKKAPAKKTAKKAEEAPAEAAATEEKPKRKRTTKKVAEEK